MDTPSDRRHAGGGAAAGSGGGASLLWDVTLPSAPAGPGSAYTPRSGGGGDDSAVLSAAARALGGTESPGGASAYGGATTAGRSDAGRNVILSTAAWRSVNARLVEAGLGPIALHDTRGDGDGVTNERALLDAVYGALALAGERGRVRRVAPPTVQAPVCVCGDSARRALRATACSHCKTCRCHSSGVEVAAVAALLLLRAAAGRSSERGSVPPSRWGGWPVATQWVGDVDSRRVGAMQGDMRALREEIASLKKRLREDGAASARQLAEMARVCSLAEHRSNAKERELERCVGALARWSADALLCVCACAVRGCTRVLVHGWY